MWSWDVQGDNASLGMMLGEGDIYETRNGPLTSHGTALKMDFGGGNGFCNICGRVEYLVEWVGIHP